MLTARQARTARAVEAWAEFNPTEGAPLDALVRAACDEADRRRADLDVSEVHAVLVAAVRAHVHAEEQRQAEEAIAGAREQERIEYLRRRGRDYATYWPKADGPSLRRGG